MRLNKNDSEGYKTDSVVISFAFASDEGFCTLDDETLTGFFIDEIKVLDWNAIVYENDGPDINSRNREGYAYMQADWIDISNSVSPDEWIMDNWIIG